MLQQFIIQGGNILKGKIKISGAKNAALPILCASLLTEDVLDFGNVPDVSDIRFLKLVLSELGVKVEDGATLKLQADAVSSCEASYDLVRKMRASFLVLGPLLTRFGHAKVSLPGGCAIGARPVDLHLAALAQLGAEIELKEGYVIASGKLKGAEIFFPMPTVGGTENVMMAATLAEGQTIIHNAATDPEVKDLGDCLVKMGAHITGHGTSVITIDGVKSLHGTAHNIIPDRLETATYAMIPLIMQEADIILTNTHRQWLDDIFQYCKGVEIREVDGGFKISGQVQEPLNLKTDHYPGLPTDVQAQMMLLMTQIEGTSSISETIFENRFMHVPELNRMGADIHIDGSTAHVCGKTKLHGAPVMATDIRASVSLVLAALIAEGQTTISRIYHLDRGYSDIDAKLKACGADIQRVKQAG